VLFAIAAIIAAVSIVYAIKPFHPTVSFGPGHAAVLLSDNSCRAPIVAAWHGSPAHWAVTIGGTSRSPVPPQIYVTPCRSSARHRLLRSGFGLLAAFVLAGLAWFLGRTR
jgi:hypothetical protein